MTRAGGYSMLQALPDASLVLNVLSVGRLLNKANLHLFLICVIYYAPISNGALEGHDSLTMVSGLTALTSPVTTNLMGYSA